MQITLQSLFVEVVQAKMEILEPQHTDLRVIARAKVESAYAKLREPVITQDSGFCITALKGWPGALLNHELEHIGVDGILKVMAGKERSCYFKQCLCYFDGGLLAPEPVFFESSIKGSLALEPRGTMKNHFWSELALVFQPAGFSKTEAEMSDEEYFAMRKKTGEYYAQNFVAWLYERLLGT